MVVEHDQTLMPDQSVDVAKPDTQGFPIVGLGASAGGLEAFEQFFRQMPPDSGMAFVVVSHLDPSHASILTEILQRSTRMSVIEAQDQMKVNVNGVYVIPPNRDMAIFHGVLQLSVPEQPRGQRMPIDAFLRSLAEDQGEQAIGIILSGTGTDGTLGLRAILGSGGISLVQEPDTAKYDGMPSSAISAGYVTHILPVEKMPEAMLSGIRVLNQSPIVPASEISGMNRILMLLRSATGHDFSHYKKSTLGRRIARRMSQHNIDSKELYARYLKGNNSELLLLFKELLINVTSFFRDPEAFDTLKQEILPLLFANKPNDYVFRIWVAGCASGEEAYSIAILLREFMDETQHEFKIQLFATDLDDDAISLARAGLFPPNIAQDVHLERLRRYFIKEDAGYRVKKTIREMVVFAIQNVIKDPPFTRLDLLSCRNLMIYLEPELQNRLIPAFHYALRPGGVLFLSPSESIGNHTGLFIPLSRKWKFYRASGSVVSRANLASGRFRTWDHPDKGVNEVTTILKETNFSELTRRVLLQTYAPASVVTDEKGNILYVYGDTGKYLRPAPGQATLNVVDMAREGLQLYLRPALNAAAQNEPVLNHEVLVKTNGDFHTVSFSVRLVPGQDVSQKLLLISFQDVLHPVSSGRGKQGILKRAELRRVGELERELAYSRENLQSTIEGQQASNEELKSINEELQSTNEELQSSNEELETSKEELQSVNEELATVNAELQAKIEQLIGMQNDMKNLLDNINIGTLFLDEHLCIKRYTRDTAKIYRLVATDVGRPLGDIKSTLEGQDLQSDIQLVLDTLPPRDRDVRTTGGVWYRVHMQPYRTLDNVIDGVVLTFNDISQRVQDESAVIQARELAEAIVNTVREPLMVLDSELRVVTASSSFYQYFQTTPENTVGQPFYQLGEQQWDIPALREQLEHILPKNQIFDGFRVESDFPVIGHRTVILGARRLTAGIDSKPLILLTIENVA